MAVLRSAGICAALVVVALVSGASAQESEVIFPVRGPNGQVQFSVHADGSASLAAELKTPRVTGSEEVQAPVVAATEKLLIGEVDVALTLDENKAERAGMAQQLEKLEAEGAANAIAEQEQNTRVEKLEADAAANAAADVELVERVSKNEADIAALKAADEEQQATQQAAEAKWEQRSQEMEQAYETKIADLTARMEADHAAQQQIIDLLVEIVAKFDVSGQLQKILEEQQTEGQ